MAGIALIGGGYGLGLATPRISSYVEQAPFRRAMAAVLPSDPIATGLDIGPPVAKLVEAGAINRDKFVKVHESRGPVPDWVLQALHGEPQELILSVNRVRDNWLSNRAFQSYDDLLDHCCEAWNKLVDQPWHIMTIGLRHWAHRF